VGDWEKWKTGLARWKEERKLRAKRGRMTTKKVSLEEEGRGRKKLAQQASNGKWGIRLPRAG